MKTRIAASASKAEMGSRSPREAAQDPLLPEMSRDQGHLGQRPSRRPCRVLLLQGTGSAGTTRREAGACAVLRQRATPPTMLVVSDVHGVELGPADLTRLSRYGPRL